MNEKLDFHFHFDIKESMRHTRTVERLHEGEKNMKAEKNMKFLDNRVQLH